MHYTTRFDRANFIISLLLIIFISGVYYYFFGIADRKIVFLYEHLNSQPFDNSTMSRYWMLGFILSAFLSIFYLVLKFILFILNIAEIRHNKILKIISLPSSILIFIITMSAGEPKLHFVTGLSASISTILGILLGFSCVDDLFIDAKKSMQYIITASGIVPFLILFRIIELPSKGILTMNYAVIVVSILFFLGLFWIIISNILFRKIELSIIKILKSALLVAYLGLPLIHYLFATPKGIQYITSADNFIAENLIIRIINWILVIIIIIFANLISKKIRALKIN